MKAGRSGGSLQWGLNLATLGVVGLVIWYVQESREISAHHSLQALHTRNSLAMGQLLEEAANYSRTDPSIVPLLQQISGRGRSQAGIPSNTAPAAVRTIR